MWKNINFLFNVIKAFFVASSAVAIYVTSFSLELERSGGLDMFCTFSRHRGPKNSICIWLLFRVPTVESERTDVESSIKHLCRFYCILWIFFLLVFFAFVPLLLVLLQQDRTNFGYHFMRRQIGQIIIKFIFTEPRFFNVIIRVVLLVYCFRGFTFNRVMEICWRLFRVDWFKFYVLSAYRRRICFVTIYLVPFNSRYWFKTCT